MKYKIALEVAEQEFARMCEANRIDSDTSEMTDAEIEKWNTLRAGIVRDLRIGNLVVGADGRPTYTPPGSSTGFTFSGATGATLIAARSKDNEIEAACLTMADLTKTDRGTFSKLATVDFFACCRVAGLFLQDQ